MAGTFRMRTTAAGVQYGLMGTNSDRPLPTVVLLNSHSAADALQDPFGGRCAALLFESGYRCATIDLPCHGEERRDGEPDELAGWAYRAARSEDFVAEMNRRLAAVIDDLIEHKLTDPQRIVLCGTSRGGFLACHFAARDRRAAAVIAFAPVTDLATLTEFKSIRHSPFVEQLAVSRITDQLAGLPIWIVIGDQDERVGTKHAQSVADQLAQAAHQRRVPNRVQFQIVSEPRGHTLPPHVGDEAAAWIQKQLSQLRTENIERIR